MNKKDRKRLLLTPEEMNDVQADAVLKWVNDKKQECDLTPRQIADYIISGEMFEAAKQFIAQAQLDKVLNPEWKDKPDSEGWWWFKGKYDAGQFDNAHPFRMIGNSTDGFITYDADWYMDYFEGKWSKAIIPEVKE